MVSIKDVAKIAGVSIATVSRYLNSPDQVRENTRNKVEKAIKDTGYAPNTLARNFRRGKTHMIVVVVPSIGIPFFEAVMEGIWHVAEEQDYSILVRDTRYNTVDFDEFSKMIFSKEADGIILLSTLSPFTYDEQVLSGRKHPPIVLSCESVTSEMSQFPSVRIDNEAAAREATQYLISLGHKKIAFMKGRSDSTLTQGREQGYRRAMSDAKLPIEPDWLLEGQMSLEGARRSTRKLLHQSDRPTAVFCANDEMAMAAIHEIKTAGLKVPDDISIIGFDDIRFSEVMDPPLTTVAQPAEEIGERTMYRLCRAIEGKEIGQATETVPHKLVVRRSTAPPPG
ncbi:LacI family transcriptional regulator [Pseudomaricurvus alkylphenolicus]|uniref:LacI family DNA-binding transcriptional regulator n=1 Tax=Pseudomaricurvus alkylphenolicus TaxID=1306991 RepID=UPI00141E598F|nr:LacI family DNA-binding transcriptional regulator [Pseudomaricurvus alkylphenolicus]NIB39953.1 LacI family transcriptional regulator [Pseudomaricurvus alkylphenolicus]